MADVLADKRQFEEVRDGAFLTFVFIKNRGIFGLKSLTSVP